MRAPQPHPGKSNQHGAALLIMLIIVILGGMGYLVSSLNKSTVNIARDRATADALKQAREALIGYAITYNDTHSGQTFGFFPCPDMDGTGYGSSDEGSSETCGSKNVSTIGRLPWKSLGLTPLRDGNGECLWYAVAGTYKNNPKADIMDWDTNGLFQVLAASGVILTGATTDSQAVAVVFSPGIPLSGQSQNRSSDSSAPLCGGNYTASNYLDSDAGIGANNSTPSATANATTKFFAYGATSSINDQLIYITKDDIFNTVRKRNDFSSFVTTLLTAASACLATHPTPVTINFDAMSDTTVTSTVGSLYIGRIPSSALTSCADTNKELVSQWRDNLLYASCTSSGCLNGSYNGVVIFTGEKSTSLGQQRITNTDKNIWSYYLEDTVTPSYNVYTAFTTGSTTLTGASSYDASSPSTDVLKYIP